MLQLTSFFAFMVDSPSFWDGVVRSEPNASKDELVMFLILPLATTENGALTQPMTGLNVFAVQKGGELYEILDQIVDMEMPWESCPAPIRTELEKRMDATSVKVDQPN